MLNPCCVQHQEKDVNYIRHFYQTGQAWNIFLQICEARGFERWHKSWIQFVLYSAINSAKWIFFKIQKKKKKLKSFWHEKVVLTNQGDISMNTQPLANEAVSIYI